MAEMPQEILEDLELLDGEIERHSPARHRSGDQIHLQIALVKLEDLIWPPTAQERTNPSEQLGNSKWLHEVVVRATVQSAHAIVDGVLRRENEDGRWPPTLT